MGCMTCKKTQNNFTLHNGPVNFGVCHTSHAYFFSVNWAPKSGFPRSFEASHIKYLDVRHSYTAILAINLVLVCLENVVGSRQNHRYSWHKDHRYRVGYWKLGSNSWNNDHSLFLNLNIHLRCKSCCTLTFTHDHSHMHKTNAIVSLCACTVMCESV